MVTLTASRSFVNLTSEGRQTSVVTLTASRLAVVCDRTGEDRRKSVLLGHRNEIHGQMHPNYKVFSATIFYWPMIPFNINLAYPTSLGLV